ncbi:type I secretion system permease/ATPase [Photobacterium sp. WH77]|uniref:type I secretion system permease/ATPase n=1 Tax=unclassified Photobacterium TaxID=2628852 RepID=UPI001EDAE6FE|nr:MULTISPECIES: type I secretion system permease/ATPase [unclassified Photobacterium]MCG2837283.1 type I secretion system permease/ATPase [Photobacterium sp. WH77]MCG2844899.1 type I secretion system permease/ATPase [Photobacterium sp. WH80]
MSEKPGKDEWLETIIWFCCHYGLRCHPLKVTAGLPLEQGQLTAELFIRAAAQVQLESGAIDKRQLGQATLPAVAVSLTGQPMILVAKEQGQYRVHLPGQSIEDQLWSDTQLLQMIQPEIWQVSAVPQSDSRVDDVKPARQMHWFRAVIREVRPWYRDMFVASIVINLLALVMPLFTMNVYDRVVPNQAFNTLWVLSVGVLVVIVFDWLLRSARSSVTDMASRYLDNKLSAQLFQRVLGMQLEHRPQSVGAFARQIQEFDSVKDFFTSITLVALIDLPFTALFLLLIGWLGGAMMFVPVTVMLGLLLLSAVMKNKIADTFTESGRYSTQRQAQLFDSLSTLTEIKQNNAEGLVQKRWEQTVVALSEWQTQSRYYSNLVSHSIMSSQQLVTVFLIALGVYQIAEGHLSMGGLIAIVMLSGRAAGSVNQLSMLLLRYQQTRSAIDGLNQIMALPQEETPHQVIDRGEYKGSFALDNVSFRYPDSELDVLENITFSVKGGERIGIIGNAGSGKSTLMALIARQLQPTHGQMYYEQLDANLWPPSVVRNAVGWVGQTPGFIFGTVYENITFGNDVIDESRLANAIELSGLNAYMPRLIHGLETQVGENGRHLSGGQKQAVAIARAFYRHSSLLLMDEPTTGLDKQATTQLFQSIQGLPRDTSIVICSHQSSFLSLCDRILVLDKGKLVADGKPQDILSHQEGRQTSRIRSVSIVKGGQHE